ncbi:MAG: GNAT family N-acetyltransferase [Lachnospiraceae bacterium]|nr:GNAT family N-acetyltransferase [Lachnospiraceae bacterium]
MIYEVKGTKRIAAFFEGWQETMIWSCLQGVMGHLYADSLEKPKSVMAVLGDFCFFAGMPNLELVAYKLRGNKKDFMIMTASSPEWFSVIESVYGKKARKVRRYAMKKESDVFDKERLRTFTETIEEGVTLHMIDQKIFDLCKGQEWSRDFVSLFLDYDDYRKKGLGVAALRDGELIAGASSYSRYRDGIEIEVDTKEEYRRRGLATACGAKLILECLDRGLYPSWDAQNLWSVALAEKLGYHFDDSYTAYEILDND